MARNNAPNLYAGGSIYPSRFIKLSTAANNTALQAGANDDVIGISGPGVIDVREDVGNAYHATTDYPSNLEAYALGDANILLKAGTGGWTRGDVLESDANGCGVVANGPGRNVGAYALESAAAGEFARVVIIKLKTGDGPVAVASADGAITATSGTVFITKTGTLAALTIAAPTATTHDGNELTIVSTTPLAHTLTLATLGFNSSGSTADVATFSDAVRGASVTLKAYQGMWYTTSLRSVTLG